MSVVRLFDPEKILKVIRENRDLPIVFMVNGKVVADDTYYWWFCNSLKAEKGIILDKDLKWTDKIYTDSDELEEDLYEKIYDDHEELSELILEESVKEKMKELEQYWKEVIFIYLDN